MTEPSTELPKEVERVLSFDKGTIDNWRLTWKESEGRDSEIPPTVEHMVVLLDSKFNAIAAEIYDDKGTRLFSKDLSEEAKKALIGLVRSGAQLVAKLPAIPGTALLIEGDTTQLGEDDFEEINEQAVNTTSRKLN